VRSLIYIFAYVFLQSVFVPVYAKAVHSSCVAIACCAAADLVFRQCWLVFTRLLPYDEKSCDCHCVQTGVTIYWHFSSETLLNKDWQFCESWRDASQARSWCSVCCGWYDRRRLVSRSAVCHTVTLSRVVWWMIRSPHSVWVLIATMTDAGCHRPSVACPATPAVRYIGVVYYAVVTTRLLLACCL